MNLNAKIRKRLEEDNMTYTLMLYLAVALLMILLVGALVLIGLGW